MKTNIGKLYDCETLWAEDVSIQHEETTSRPGHRTYQGQFRLSSEQNERLAEIGTSLIPNILQLDDVSEFPADGLPIDCDPPTEADDGLSWLYRFKSKAVIAPSR